MGVLLACSVSFGCSKPAPAGDTAAAAPATEAPAAAPAEPAEAGPVHVLVTLPVGAQAPAGYTQQLAALKASGAATSVQLLEVQPNAEPPGFESLAIIDFKDGDAYHAWNREEAAKLGSSLKVRRADILAQDVDAGRDSSTAFFAVNHYESLVSADEYKRYTEAYIQPNMAHQKSTGAMTGWTMYLEREPAGTNAQAVLVKEYLSASEQSRAEESKGKHKTEVLLANPEWKRINDTKGTIRKDLTETFAKPAAL